MGVIELRTDERRGYEGKDDQMQLTKVKIQGVSQS